MQTEGGVGDPRRHANRGRGRETPANMQTEGGVGTAQHANRERGRGTAPNVQKGGRPAHGIRQTAGSGDPRPNNEKTLSRSERRQLLFMAAVAGETIKGFHVAHEACRLLRQTRSDFELVVTFDPPGQIDEFTRSVGWCSQADLPRQYRAADICLVPTIAQDGPSITSVEAMAAGIPVIAGRIGGVPYTVSDGVTGLLCGPGDPVNLAANIARLLDDTDLSGQCFGVRCLPPRRGDHISAQGNALVVPHKFARAAEPRFKDPEPNRWWRNGTRWYERGAWPRPWRCKGCGPGDVGRAPDGRACQEG